jgi:hypothetical protein
MEWLQHKTIIRKLYLDDDLSLQSLMAYMETTYGFVATVNMFKKRLLAWDFRKNYRRQDKEAVLTRLEKESVGEVSDLTINGRPVLLGRVRRFEREERNARMKVAIISYAGRHPAEAHSQHVTPQIQQRTLQRPRVTTKRIPPRSRTAHPATTPPSIIRSNAQLEHLLHLVCTLYDDSLMREYTWQQSQIRTPQKIHIRNTSRDTRSGWPSAAWVDIGLALHYLSTAQSVLGFWYLERACHEIKSSLEDPKADRPVEFHSLADIIDLFCDAAWDRFPELKRHLLYYLIGLSRTKEGQTHPLSLLWSSLDDRQELLSCRDVVQRRLSNGFERTVGRWRITLRCHYPRKEPPQLLYGHSQWRWERHLLEPAMVC